MNEADRARLAKHDAWVATLSDSDRAAYKGNSEIGFLRRLLREAEAERDQWKARYEAQGAEYKLARERLMALADEAVARDRAVAEARRLAIEECAQVAVAVADEKLPEPYWDNDRARRMDWGCACGRILGRIRGLSQAAERPPTGAADG